VRSCGSSRFRRRCCRSRPAQWNSDVVGGACDARAGAYSHDMAVVKGCVQTSVVVVLAAGMASGQRIFRATTKLVNVAFVATDAQGALVRNLGESELQVFEDGDAQKIAFFSPSYDLPLTMGVLLDISGSQSKFLRQHRKDLTSFLQAVLQAHDRAFLVCIDNHLRLVSDYTPSGATLLWTLEHFRVKFGYPELGPAQ